MSKRVWLGIACGLILTCHLAVAQPVQLPPITVQGEQLDESQFVRETSTFATVVNTQDATARVDSVSELLTENVGVQVRRFGGLGAFSTVSIRGSTPNQVDVYLDNVRLNQARAGLVDLGDLPLDNVERIEIYRGFAPLQLGASSIGGAVHLVTHRVAGQTLNRASISYGSFHTRKLTLYRSQGFEHFGYLTLFNYTESDGDFKFLDDNGTRFTTDDDETVTRRNNDFRSFNINTKGDVDLWGWDLRLSNDFFTKDQGVPGRSSVQSDTARLDVYRNVATLHAERSGFPYETIDLDLQLSYTWQREDFQDPKGDIGTGIQDQEDTTQTWSGQSLFNLYLDAWHQIVGLMLEWRYETFRTINKLPELRGQPALRGPLQRRTNLIVAFQDEIVLFDERLAIRPLFRYQFVASRFGAQPRFRTLPVNLDRSLHDHLLSPSLGVKFSLMSYLDLKGNIGRFQRLPTLFELFGDRGTTIGNDKLKPETSVNWDVGFVIELPRYGIVDRVLLEYAYFGSDADDLILFVQNSQVSARAMNISAAKIRGHELSWRATLWGHLRVYGNYTFQDAEDTSETFSRGNTLPGRPRHELHQAFELFMDTGKLVYELDYIAQNFLDRANAFEVDNRILHNLSLTLTPLGKRLKLTFEVKNIGDNQVQDFRGFPLPGRSFFGTLEGRF